MEIPYELISTFCQRWKVVEFSMFGSVLRTDFDINRNVDVFVTYEEGNQISLFDLAQLQIELQKIFNRPVDILEKEALRNPFGKRHILETAQVVYATSVITG